MSGDTAIAYYDSVEGSADSEGEGVVEYPAADLTTKGCYVFTESVTYSQLQFCVYR